MLIELSLKSIINELKNCLSHFMHLPPNTVYFHIILTILLKMQCLLWALSVSWCVSYYYENTRYQPFMKRYLHYKLFCKVFSIFVICEISDRQCKTNFSDKLSVMKPASLGAWQIVGSGGKSDVKSGQGENLW